MWHLKEKCRMKHSVTLGLPATTANRKGQWLVHCLMQFMILFCTIQIQIWSLICILFSLCSETALTTEWHLWIFFFSFFFFMASINSKACVERLNVNSYFRDKFWSVLSILPVNDVCTDLCWAELLFLVFWALSVLLPPPKRQRADSSQEEWEKRG